MGLGFFAGAAAEKTNESLQGWRDLFQREKVAQQQYELQKAQQSQTARLQRDAQAFQMRLEEMRNAWNENRLDRQEAMAVGQATIDNWDDMDPAGRARAAETMRETGNIFAPVVSNLYTRGLFTDPAQAFDLVNSVFTAPIGTAFTDEFVYSALDSVAAQAGWDEDKKADFRAEVETALEARRTDAEAFEEMSWERLQTELDQGAADLANTQARTDLVTQQAASVFQDTQFNAEEHPYILENLQLTNEVLTGDVARGEIENGYLPDQIEASLAETWSRVQNNEDQHILFTRTVDATVREMTANADITEEQARHLIATGMYRDAIAQYDAENTRLGADHLRATIAVAWANEGLITAQTDLTQLDMTEGVVAIASRLVEEGRSDLLATVAPDLFANLPEEQRNELVASLTETADSNMSNRRKLEDANMRIAIADAEWAESRPDRYEDEFGLQRDQYELDAWYKQRGIQLSERELDLREQQIVAERAAAEAATGVNPGTVDAFEYAEDATDMTVNDLGTYIEDRDRISADLARITGDVPLTGDMQQDATAIRAGLEGMSEAGIVALAEQYGFNTDLAAQSSDFLQDLPAVILRDHQAANARVEQRIGAWMRAFEMSAGRPPTASEIGMNENDPMYLAAVERTRGIDPLGDLGEELDDVSRTAQGLVLDLMPRIGADGFTLGGAQAMWDTLVEEHGEEAVEQSYGTPSAMMEAMDPVIREIRPLVLSAQDTLDTVSEYMPEEFQDMDVTNAEHRYRALNWLESAGTRVDQFFETFDSLEEPPPLAGGFDAVFGSNFGNRDVEVQQDLVSQVLNLGVDRAILADNGIIDASNRIINRAAFRQVLVGLRDSVASSYEDLALVNNSIR